MVSEIKKIYIGNHHFNQDWSISSQVKKKNNTFSGSKPPGINVPSLEQKQ